MIENINGLYSVTYYIQTSWDLDLFITLDPLVASYLCIISYSCITAAFSQSYVVQNNYDYDYDYWVKTAS